MKKLLPFLLIASPLFAQTTIQQWNFTENSGSGIASLLSEAGLNTTFFSAGSNVETAFDGGYTVNRTAGFSGNVALGGSYSDANATSVTISVTLKQFAFNAGTSNTSFSVRLGDGTTNNLAVLSFVKDNTNNRINLQATGYNGATANTYVGGAAVSGFTGGPITYGATFNLQANTYVLWVGTPSSGSETWSNRLAAYTGTYTSLGATALSHVSWGWSPTTAGDYMILDQVDISYVAPVPEPSTYAGLAGLAALGLVAFHRRPQMLRRINAAGELTF